VKVEEYIIELAKKEFGENLIDVDFLLPLDGGEDANAEIILREEEDDEEVTEKLARIYFTVRKKGFFVPVSWVIDNSKAG
jgi:hypothetical protein